MGRLQDYAVCLEAALKLKETSYIQAEGYASGELKHGPIALIEEGTPVFVLITQDDIAKNTRNNAEEVKARGGNTCVIAREGLDQRGIPGSCRKCILCLCRWLPSFPSSWWPITPLWNGAAMWINRATWPKV